MNSAQFSLPLAILIASGISICSGPRAPAADGEPIAIRVWPAGAVSIENQWGLSILVDPQERAGHDLPIDPDQTLNPTRPIAHVLARQPNTVNPTWQPANASNALVDNSIAVVSIETEDIACGVTISVDGVRLAYISDQWPTDLTKIADLDVLIYAATDSDRIVANANLIRKRIRPKCLLLNRMSGDHTSAIGELRSCFGKNLVVEPDRQTLAVSTAPLDRDMPIVVLGQDPWQMPEALAELFLAMEKSNLASQAVFAPLSVDQMNFQPANGTHTPRWNTEHMMGRQLLFFSQIYHELDSAIPVMDLNPAQMPTDYTFRHADWDGWEEARQMQRANDFTRRFAYLLDGIDLDKKAPGSRWTLRGLLQQMERHYGEHTANTIKKFALPGWPTK